MMNLSSLSKALIFCVLGIVGVAGLGLYCFVNSHILLGVTSAIVLCLNVGVYFYVRAALKDIHRVSQVAEQASGGYLDNRIIHVSNGGEIRALMDNVNHLLDQTEAFAKEAGAALEYASRGKYFRKIILRGITGDFIKFASVVNEGLEAMDKKTKAFRKSASDIGQSIKGVVGTVSSSAQQLEASAAELGTLAKDTSDQSNTVNYAASGASNNVESVAAATEEFNASIREIHEQVERSAKMASDAVGRAREANIVMDSLNEAGRRIGEVVKLISEIADQTNMLALNATIEAARAGEAGKGFGVVAGEVKDLANQTSSATEEIYKQVSAMQVSTEKAVETIRLIGDAIEAIDQNATQIASTVEEQSAAVTEISSNSQYAVMEVRKVADTIKGVADGAGRSSESVGEIQSASSNLASQSLKLSKDVDDFLEQVMRA